jgi:hypothetical protein
MTANFIIVSRQDLKNGSEQLKKFGSFLTRHRITSRPLLFMIINYDQTGVNYTRDPQKESEHEAKQEAAQPSGEQYR